MLVDLLDSQALLVKLAYLEIGGKLDYQDDKVKPDQEGNLGQLDLPVLVDLLVSEDHGVNKENGVNVVAQE